MCRNRLDARLIRISDGLRLPVYKTAACLLSYTGGRNGMTGPVIAIGLAHGDRLGLTVAPEDGSPRPASAPVLMLNLTT